MTLKGLALYIFFYLVQAFSLYIIDVNSQVSHNNNPFRFFLHPSMNWHQAKDFCETNDLGQIAVIFDEQEQAFVRDNFLKHGKSFWLGLNDPQGDGNFVMINGNAPEYVHWRPGQPNSRGTCAYMSEGGHWYAQPCDEKMSVLCRIMPKEVTTFAPDTTSQIQTTVANAKSKKGSSKTETPNYEGSTSNSALGGKWTTNILAMSSVILAFMLKYNL